MLVLMRQDATPDQIREVKLKIGDLGFRAHEIPGAERTAIGITGNHGGIAAGCVHDPARCGAGDPGHQTVQARRP